MTLTELVKMLKATGYPVAFSHFEATEQNPAPNPPFITYTTPSTENMHADNKTYQKAQNVDIELYTVKKDLQAEQKIESLLEQHEIPWESYEVYIESERLFQKLYEITII